MTLQVGTPRRGSRPGPLARPRSRSASADPPDSALRAGASCRSGSPLASGHTSYSNVGFLSSHVIARLSARKSKSDPRPSGRGAPLPSRQCLKRVHHCQPLQNVRWVVPPSRCPLEALVRGRVLLRIIVRPCQDGCNTSSARRCGSNVPTPWSTSDVERPRLSASLERPASLCVPRTDASP